MPADRMHEDEYAFLFSGQLQKMKIVSNCLGFGPCPKPDDEVEQHLTIIRDGRIYFSAYCFGSGEKYQKSGSKNFKIDSEKASFILDRIQNYFEDEFDTPFVTDVGSWNMVLTNTEGKKFAFQGSLCNIVDELGDLSEMVRENLNLPNLMMFDDEGVSDRIEEIKIKYHRMTKIKPNSIPEDATWEFVTWDYNESIEINREQQFLTLTQMIGTGCKVSRRYDIEGGISNLLDGLFDNDFLNYIEGNDDDVVKNPLETKDYEIEIEFLNAGKKIITGTFDKNGLPADFGELAETIQDFMFFYGMGEILDPRVYGKKLRKKNEMIFCNVSFDDSGKTYCYLTEDESIDQGDVVVVPVGTENKEKIVKVESVEYYTSEKAPFPIGRIKKIIRKYDDKIDE